MPSSDSSKDGFAVGKGSPDMSPSMDNTPGSPEVAYRLYKRRFLGLTGMVCRPQAVLLLVFNSRASGCSQYRICNGLAVVWTNSEQWSLSSYAALLCAQQTCTQLLGISLSLLIKSVGSET